MVKLTRLPVVSEGGPTRREGVDTLHAACLTLARTAPDLIRSMSVLVSLADFPLPATSVVDLVERVAAEYGLVATAELKAQHLAVRLLRCNGQTAQGNDR